MRSNIWYWGAAMALFLGSCTADNTPVGDVKLAKTPFYDLKSYFQEEAHRLDSIEMSVQKWTRVNDNESMQVVDSIDWQQELKAFRESDINRASWVNKYQGDTMRTAAGTIEKISYQALKKDLKVQLIEIHFDDTQVSAIHLTKRNRSLIAESDQQLSYQPATGYELSSQQKVLFSRKTTVEVKAEFE